MATEGACAIKNQVAVFHRAVIIDYFYKGIAFGADRIFQYALLNLNRYSTPKQHRLGCKFFFAHAGNISGSRLSHDVRTRACGEKHQGGEAGAAGTLIGFIGFKTFQNL